MLKRKAPTRLGEGQAALWFGAAVAAITAAIIVVLVVSRPQTTRDATTPQGSKTAATTQAAPTSSEPTSLVKPGPTTAAPTEPPVKPNDPNVVLFEDFAGQFPGTKWVLTRDGDFKEAIADVVAGRLRLRAGTIGARDDTVKHLGIRTAEPVVDFSSPIELAAEIDWNNQANGCYLHASLVLAPTATDGTAAKAPENLVFEYVGVPPGKNARAVLARHKAGQLRQLFTEGWPEKQRTGRPIGKQKVALRLGPETVEIIENGKPLFGPAPHDLTFRRAHLYIELCSHSNYPPRELFFDDITVRRLPPAR
jgi:hypothetical protein